MNNFEFYLILALMVAGIMYCFIFRTSEALFFLSICLIMFTVYKIGNVLIDLFI